MLVVLVCARAAVVKTKEGAAKRKNDSRGYKVYSLRLLRCMNLKASTTSCLKKSMGRKTSLLVLKHLDRARGPAFG